MGYTLMDKIKMLICKIFGHFPKDHWHYKIDHANCRCCGKVLSRYGNGKWV